MFNKGLPIAGIASLLLLNPAVQAAGIRISVVSDDTGLSDTTPVTAVGGNNGATLGQQRMNAIQAAIDFWQSALDINSEITVEVSYKKDVACSANQGFLASAGYNFTWHSFDGAPMSGVWYPASLAVNLHPQWRSEQDLPDQWKGKASMRVDINAIGQPTCLASLDWYYGLDEQPPSTQRPDLYNVLRHEIGHALGFATVTDISTGQYFDGRADAFAHFLYDADQMKRWTALDAAGRKASATNTGGLTWNGEEVNRLTFALATGKRDSYAQMWAPATLESGSSVSHFDNALSYDTSLGLKADELMEPWESVSEDDLLTIAVMGDLGWEILRDTDNDGMTNAQDVFPLDATEQGDWDHDGVGDNADAFPFDATEQLDSDSDGIGDNKDPDPTVANTPDDSDGDGVADAQDAFPNNPRESVDADGDGVGDNADPFDNEACTGSRVVVASAADSGAGTLREAIRKVCPEGVVAFDQAMSILLINELVISQPLSIDAADFDVVLDGSSANGRAIRIEAGHLVSITGLHISDFFEGTYGGAIASEGELTLDRCTFSNNFGGDFGGAIYASQGTVKVTNSVFYNQSSVEALDIYAAPTLDESHVINNTFWRSARRADRTSVEIYGAGDFKNNILGGALQADFCRKNDRVQASHNLILDQTCGATLSVDPELTDPDAGDFTPKTGSPVIDAGTDVLSVTAKDHQGQNRKQGSATDIGAIEFPSSGGGSNGEEPGSGNGGGSSPPTPAPPKVGHGGLLLMLLACLQVIRRRKP